MTADQARLPRVARWGTALGLGLRMAFAGGRDARLRTLLIATGVGLGVAALLLAASVPGMRAHRDDRLRALSGVMFSDSLPAKTDRTLLLSDISTTYHGEQVVGRAVRREGAAAPVPPGLTAYPAPGALAVSPALAELLASPDGRLLRQRLPGPITGTIGESGLVGPADLVFYQGSDRLGDGFGRVVRADHFADPLPPKPTSPALVLLTVVGLVLLLCPVVVFLVAAVRFGGEARDRRLAALRLTGADRATTARIAAGEALGGALLGLLLGVLFFLVGRAQIERISVDGLSFFAVDIQPQPSLAALALLAVPLLAVLVTLVAMRRIAAEPLGVLRGARTARRRVWWRIALPVLGTALLVSRRNQFAGATSSSPSLLALIAGLLLLLVGTTLLLPLLLDLAARALGRIGGPPAWQLAVGRLRFSPETGSRPVTGIVVAVAGAIALQSLFGGVSTRYTAGFSLSGDPTRYIAVFHGNTGDQIQQLSDRVSAGGTIADVRGYTEDYALPLDGPGLVVTLVTSSCRVLRTFAQLPDCVDGDVFTVPGSADSGLAAGSHSMSPVPGLTGGDLTAPVPGLPGWRLPAARAVVTGLPALPGSHDGQPIHTTVLATTGAVPPVVLHAQEATLLLHPVPGLRDAEESLRTTVTLTDPRSTLLRPGLQPSDPHLLGVRRALTAGTLAVLTLIGASMLVGLLEQLRDRRRTLAVLTAFGTRRRTLAWSLLLQSALPVLVGLVLAVAAGVGLAALLLGLAGVPFGLGFSLGDTAVLAGGGAAAVLAVTLLSLPALWRRTRAAGLRWE
ncbi:FtsX-like permease family protein [Kitasatospora sp. NPDC006697]|uniref:FtsX-like permease family protein n=1 Tax=Kitasatospora sp. NPDC006697 TaxID=3364020 RepID=UPI00369EDB4D